MLEIVTNKTLDRISSLNNQIKEAVKSNNRLKLLFFPEGYNPIQLLPISPEFVKTDNSVSHYDTTVNNRSARDNTNLRLNLQTSFASEDKKEKREEIALQMRKALDEIAGERDIAYNNIKAHPHLANDLRVILRGFFQENPLFQSGLKGFVRKVLNCTPLVDEVGTGLIMAKAVDHPDRESILNSLIPVLKALTTDKFRQNLTNQEFQEKIKESLELLARYYSYYIFSWINSPTEDNVEGINLSAKVLIVLFSELYPIEQA